jgi:alkanesulfonate monooxygenase SsuD/methylene tetrahydromethanopterin reductase-like flavin-dependent oxidoreductase (luciferase family)
MGNIDNNFRIGTTLDFVPPLDAVQLGLYCEKLGFDTLWAVDHLIDNGGMKPEPWTTISAIGAQTKKVHFSTGVTDAQRSHPARTAHSVATLAELTGGRVSLGIGAGEAMNLVPFGLPFDKPSTRAQRLAEAIQVIRLLWTSTRLKPVSFQGTFFQLRNAWLDTPTKYWPKIFVGALGGTFGLKVAGEFGDGWIPWVNSVETFSKRLTSVKSARKSRDPFEAVAWIFLSHAQGGPELKEAISYAKKALLAEVHTLESVGFKMPKELVPYQQMLVTDAADQAINDRENSIPDELALQFLTWGSPSQIIEKIERFRSAGATQLCIEFVQRGHEPLDLFAKNILSHYGKRGA